MAAQEKINISEIVDNSELTPFHWTLIFLSGLCLIMDGFDVQAMGYVAPVLIREWGVPNSALGPVFSAALVGVLFGQALLSRVIPYHPARPFFDALVRPFLKPFQRIIPLVGGVDLSPFALLLILQVVLMVPVAYLEKSAGALLWLTTGA